MSRQLGKLIFVAFAAMFLQGCDAGPTELRLVTPHSPIDRDIAAEFSRFLSDNSAFNIQLTGNSLADEGAIEALLSGDADLALISNNMPFRSGVATVMPLYPTVLHIGYRIGREVTSSTELLDGATVFAGSQGSASRFMFERIHVRMNPDVAFNYAESIEDGLDVFAVFAPVSPDRLDDYPGFTLYSLGIPDEIGRGAIVDTVNMMNPQIRPFIIPVHTYGTATPEPVVSVAVDMMLVARSDLSTPLIYDLVTELLRLKPALAALRPGLFQQMSDNIETNSSTFVLHPGLLAYTQRNEPTAYERYSGVAEVLVTVIVASISGLYAAARFLRRRKKDRIDSFYTEILRIRQEALSNESGTSSAVAIEKVRALQTKAFAMLVEEKLAADESFRIFITLSNDVLKELA